MIDENIGELEEKSGKIILYLEKMKTSLASLAKAELFSENENNKVAVSELRNGYAVILSLFWKMRAQNNFEYVNKCKNNVLRKLDEIERLEKIVYDLLTETGNEKI